MSELKGPDDAFISAALTDARQAGLLLTAQPALPYASIYAACAAGDAEAAAKLIGTGAVSVFSFGGPRRWPPLLYACYSLLNGESQRHSGFARCAELLLERGADANASHVEPAWPDSPQSALYGATGVNCNPALTQVLLEHGARAQDGESIYHAAQHNHVACLEVLAAHGADFSSRQQPWDNTPLYFLLGAWPGDTGWDALLAGLRWLLGHGADPNVSSTATRETPLHRAARYHEKETIALLLDHGADATQRDAADVAPCQLAVRYANPDAMEEFRRRGVECELTLLDRLLAACAMGDAEHAKVLLTEQPELLKTITEQQGQLIADLAGLGRTAAVQAHLDLGVLPSVRAEQGGTPLHFACWRGHLDTAQALVQAGAPLDVKDGEYQGTPLDWVCHGSLNAPGHEDRNYASLARLLLRAGAKKPEQPWGSEAVRKALAEG